MVPATRTPQGLLQRLDEIALVLAGRGDALGLLGLGSCGQEMQRLDAYSDLDFFVLVRPGAKVRYTEQLDWLAQAYPLSWHFQNTVDGHKALMSDGVFCEFAVFEPQELASIPYSPGRFIWRRDELDPQLANPARALPDRRQHGRDWLVGEVLANLMVGMDRYRRGEVLSAMRHVQVFALDRLLELHDQIAEPKGITTDPFVVERRFELRHPDQLERLSTAAGGYEKLPESISAQLAWLEHLDIAVPRDVRDRLKQTPST
jgi:hypothetical protein